MHCLQQAALVVADAAAPEAAVRQDRLERRHLPVADRVHRLYVIVAIDQRCRRALRCQPLAVHDRLRAGLQQLHVLRARHMRVYSQRFIREPGRLATLSWGAER